MSTITNWKCDRCGKSMGDQSLPRLCVDAGKGEKWDWTLDIEATTFHNSPDSMGDVTPRDLCAACLKALLKKAKIVLAYRDNLP